MNANFQLKSRGGSALTALCASALLAVGTTPATAQITTDRPSFTESTATVPQGRVQLEAGYTFSRFGSLDMHTVGEALLRLGVIPGLELRAGLPSYISASADVGLLEFDESGIGDAHLGMKLGLYQAGVSEGLPSVSLLLGTGVPTGRDALPESAGGWEPEAGVALGWDLTETLALGATVKYAQRDPHFGDRYDEWAGSVALGFPITQRLGGFGEYFAIRPGVGGADAEQDYLNGGVTWLIAPDLQLDARVGVGIDSPVDDDFFFGVGFAKLF